MSIYTGASTLLGSRKYRTGTNSSGVTFVVPGDALRLPLSSEFSHRGWIRFFFEITSPGGKLKYRGGTFFIFQRGEINIPGRESPRGMRKKVGGHSTQRPSTLLAMEKSMSNSSSAPGWMRDLAGKRKKPGRKAAGGVWLLSALIRVERVAVLLGVLRLLVLLTFVVRMVSHAWGYRVESR